MDRFADAFPLTLRSIPTLCPSYGGNFGRGTTKRPLLMALHMNIMPLLGGMPKSQLPKDLTSRYGQDNRALEGCLWESSRSNIVSPIAKEWYDFRLPIARE